MRTAFHIAILFLVFISTSCNKKDESISDYGQGTGRCRLKSYTTDYPEPGLASRTADFHYDDRNRLQRVSYYSPSLTSHVEFVYEADYVLRRQTYASGQRADVGDSITLDGAGRITGIYTKSYAFGTSEVIFYDRLYYNAAGQHVATDRDTSTVYFFWQEGNLISDSSKRHACFYTYNSDRPSQYASSEALGQFSNYGQVVDGTVHLLKSLSRYGSTSSFIYAFDADGKIIADTVVGLNGPEKYDAYKYECL